MKRVVVIGGGPSGMMAAYAASINGAEVILLEQNEKTGKKLYITGKGRCNLTNECDRDVFIRNIVSNGKFLYSAYSSFSSEDTMSFFENHGCALKTERGNRVFPDSDKSSDVIRTLDHALKQNKVDVRLHSRVTGVLKNGDGSFLIRYIRNDENMEIISDALIISTGGMTYPSTGSCGFGYGIAESFGHTLTEPKCALVPFNIKEEDIRDLQGLSLKNVSITLKSDPDAKKCIYEGFGEMLFTHFGVSGPLILSASSFYAGKLYDKTAYLSIDLKPALSHEKLIERIERDLSEAGTRILKNSLLRLLPSSLIPVIIKRSSLDPDKKAKSLSLKEKGSLAETIKDLRLTVTGTRGENEAIITQGGVNVKEIDPGTMGSKIVEGLYFAGEVLDLDALTGGFNLQIAWSTGYVAGKSAAENR